MIYVECIDFISHPYHLLLYIRSLEATPESDSMATCSMLHIHKNENCLQTSSAESRRVKGKKCLRSNIKALTLFKNTIADVAELRRWHWLCGLSCGITPCEKQSSLMYTPHSISSIQATSASKGIHTHIHTEKLSLSHRLGNYLIIYYVDAILIHSLSILQ